MLIDNKDLEGILASKITLAFRRWKKPTVKSGGRLRTHKGVLAIHAVDLINESDISDRDSKKAGFSSKKDLLEFLSSREGSIYRVSLSFQGPDERIELRADSSVSDEEWVELRKKLTRLDEKSQHGPWVSSFLETIANNPGVLSTTLAASIGLERQWFKEQMRKLKELGLTESLEVGYRISPRGKVVLSKFTPHC